jgi:hypothetical protein
MGLSQLFDRLREYTDPDGHALIEEIHGAVQKYDPDIAADALETLLNVEGVPDEVTLELAAVGLDQLEAALKKFYTPHPQQVKSHKKDMLRWFEYMRHFHEIGRLDGMRDIMTFYWKMFARGGKKICGSVRSRCAQSGWKNSKCNHKFQKGEYVCPNCDMTRTLCRKKPMQNGRCGKSGSGGHGGDLPIGALAPRFIDGRKSLGRAKLFAQQLEDRQSLRRMYIEALQDPDYLSLEADMAMMTARRAELLAELDALDPQLIETSVRNHVKEMGRAMGKDKYSDAMFHANEIQSLLEKGKDNRERWREWISITSQVAKLADTERKRIVEARQFVPIQEMINLQNETIKAVRNAIAAAAEEAHTDIMRAREKGILDKLSPDQIRRVILRNLAAQMRPIEQAEREIGEIVEG